jgi:catechol 2,3-dioxygenase-like lactoylglutathione lyase family enzyme
MLPGSQIMCRKEHPIMSKPILGTTKPTQIAVIVKDVEQAKRKYAAFFGVDLPPTVDAGDYRITQTRYRGEPAPDAGCKMAFFDLQSIQFELIEPNAARSTWRDFLEEKGEGLHHMAFDVKDLDESVAACEALGMTLTQRGYYGDASGAYAYVDATQDLGCFIELLCSFGK